MWGGGSSGFWSIFLGGGVNKNGTTLRTKFSVTYFIILKC